MFFICEVAEAWHMTDALYISVPFPHSYWVSWPHLKAVVAGI